MRRENSLNGKIWRAGVITELLCGLFSSTFDLLAGVVENFIKEQEKRILKKLSVAVVFFTGGIFLLNSLALYINALLEKAVWVGYGIVGGVLVLLSLIFWKE